MSLSARFLASVCLFACLLCGGLYYGGTIILNQAEGALLGLNSRNAQGAVDAVLRQAERNLILQSRTISRDREVGAFLADGDIEGLEAHTLGNFNRMVATGDVSDIAYFNADGEPVLSRSETEGVIIEDAPAVVLAAMESGRRVFMLDRIDEDRFVTAYAFPVLQGRTAVGYVLIAKSVESKLAEIGETIGGDVILVRTRDGAFDKVIGAVIAEPAPEETVVAEGEGAPGETPDVASGDVVGAAAENDLPELLPEDIARGALTALGSEQNEYAMLALGERHSVVTSYSIGDTASGGHVDLLLMGDVSQEYQSQADTKLRVGLAALGVLFLVLVAMLVWLRLQLRPLQENAAALAALANGEIPDRPKHNSTATEIAELSRAMERFLAKREAERSAFQEISNVVDACADGDFSCRVQYQSDDETLGALCSGVNAIGESADRGLREVQAALAQLRKGNLMFRMSGDFAGVFAEIAAAMNEAASAMGDAMADVGAASTQVGHTTEELRAVAESLATTTERNSGQLEETAAMLQEITGKMERSAETAQTTQTTVQRIDAEAAEGRAQMSRTVAAMHQIEKSARDIDTIVLAIEDLAFQTNLLALNAGVEAARAGEAGRGFAVVASEVRALAQRSSDSAREIQELVAESSQSVQDGAKLVEATGATFNYIAEGIAEAGELVVTIASAASDTAQTVARISRATDDLRNGMQNNAAMSEESSAAVMSVRAQVDTVTAAVARFQFEPTVDRAGEALRRSA